jgi:hypothetical protein
LLAFSSSWELLLLCRRRERVELSLFDLWGEGAGGEKRKERLESKGTFYFLIRPEESGGQERRRKKLTS